MDPIKITKDILSIKSANGHEKELAEYLRDTLKEMGLYTEMILHSKTSASLFAKSSGEQRLCINCHIDVVPYVVNPLREDRNNIYGEGAVDTKKDIGPLIAALDSLKDIPDGLVLAFDADEEYSNLGMKALVGKIDAPSVIVNEPTNMEVHIGFRGWTEIVVEANASQVHSCYSRRDDSFTKLVRGLYNLTKGFKKKDECGEAGVVISTFPLKRKDDAFIPQKARADLLILNNLTYNTREKILSEISRCSPELEARIEELWPAFINKNSKVGKALQECNLKTGIHLAWTNANYFVDRDVVIFGAGNPVLGHTNNEYVEKRQLIDEKKVYLKMLNKFLA